MSSPQMIRIFGLPPAPAGAGAAVGVVSWACAAWVLVAAIAINDAPLSNTLLRLVVKSDWSACFASFRSSGMRQYSQGQSECFICFTSGLSSCLQRLYRAGTQIVAARQLLHERGI